MAKVINAMLKVGSASSIEDSLKEYMGGTEDTVIQRLIELSNDKDLIRHIRRGDDGRFDDIVDSALLGTLSAALECPENKGWKVEVVSDGDLRGISVSFHPAYGGGTYRWRFSADRSQQSGTCDLGIPQRYLYLYSAFYCWFWQFVLPNTEVDEDFEGEATSFKIGRKYLLKNRSQKGIRESVVGNMNRIAELYANDERTPWKPRTFDRSLYEQWLSEVKELDPYYLEPDEKLSIHFQLVEGGEIYSLFQMCQDGSDVSTPYYGFIVGNSTEEGNPTKLSDIDYLKKRFLAEVKFRDFISEMTMENRTLAMVKKILAPIATESAELITRIREYVKEPI